MGTFWANRKVFLTGATGFVGSHIARKLVDLGAVVICLERDSSANNSLDLFQLRSRVTVVSGGLDDIELLERVLNEYEIDAVFHLAAQALVGAANRSPLSTFETNLRGTYLLLEACRRSEWVKRIVVASSDKAYGTHATLPYTETFELRGRFPYDVSKACADLISQSFAVTYGLPVTVTRCSNIYGDGDLNFSRIIPGTIKSVFQGDRPVIRSNGSPVREFVHVNDVVDGYLSLAEEISLSRGEVYNFGTNTPIDMLSLVELIIRMMGKDRVLAPEIMSSTKIEREIDAQFLSPKKISDQFGWEAKVGLETGLAATISWYESYFADGAR